jgi:IclR family acetate operon transcriptional repressor
MSVQTLECDATLAIQATRAERPRRAARDVVQSLVRALDLLEILSGRACRLTELAQRAKLPPSTTHRLLTTLEQKRFVCFDREENLWSVSSHCYAIGSGYLRREALFTQAAPMLNSLASQVGAAANLGVLEGGRLILVRQAVGCENSPVHPPGANLPLHATALGKVLLAGGDSQPQLRGYLAGPLARLTNRTICDPLTLTRQLKQIKMLGIAFDDEESLIGRRCLAAPVQDELGQCVGAISITSTQSLMTDHSLERLGGMLTAVATQVARTVRAYEKKALEQPLYF